jgi:hypothetical protein
MDLTAISTGNQKVDHLIGLGGTLVTVASLAAAQLNHKVREAMDSEGEVPDLFLWLALVLNCLALNIDKAAQMQKLLKGHPVKQTIKKVEEEKKEEPKAEEKPAEEAPKA